MRSISKSIKSLKVLPAPLIKAAEKAASRAGSQVGGWSAVNTPIPTERAVIKPLSGRGSRNNAVNCDKEFS